MDQAHEGAKSVKMCWLGAKDKLVSFGPRFTFLKQDTAAMPASKDFDARAMKKAEKKLAAVEKAVRREDAAAAK